MIPLLLASMHETNSMSRYNVSAMLQAPWLDMKNLVPLEPAIMRSEPELITALDDSEPMIRATAAHLLGILLPERSQVIHPLLQALQDPDVSVRVNAAGSLGRAKTELETDRARAL